MVAFSALVAIGIQFVPAGRAIVLGYTTPLWVIPAARLFLGEPITRYHLAGGALALGGLAIMFNPAAFDWSDGRALLSNALLLLAAACWAVSIVYVRAHRWISTPFQLVFWEALPAAVTSLGLLATPVVGTLSAALGEPITLALLGAMTLIVGGIALGTIMRPR
jgi:drug/metabolite transporter (DMT)-like permease